jgi:HD-GYP domain-containing protein (c-di-GMP phosphodiesterase class II)
MEGLLSLEEKFSIVQEISSLITEKSNINDLANLLLERATNYTNAEKGSFMLINEKGELYILEARGFSKQFIDTYKVRMGEGIAGMVARNRSPVLVEDIDRDERFSQKKWDHYKTKAFISCPIISREKVLGVININDKKDGTPFTKDEMDILMTIAAWSAIAIENLFLMDQLRTKALELENINRKLIENDISKTEFITRISHELRSPLNSVKGAVYYLQQSEKLSKGKKKEFYDIISKETEQLISIVEDLLDFLRLEDESRLTRTSLLNLKDLLNELSESKSFNDLLAEKNIKIKMDINEGTYNIVGDKIKIIQLFINLIEGLMNYLRKNDRIGITVKENDFIKVELNFFRKMPETVFSVLYSSKYIFRSDLPDNVMRLYLARKVIEAHRWGFEIESSDNNFFVFLYIPKSTKDKIEAVVNQSMDMFVEFISELLELNICSIMLSDDVTSELTIKGFKGLSDEIVKLTRIQFGDQIAGWVASEGRPLLIEDIESDSRFKRKSIPRYNTKSLLSVPIKLKEKVIGVLNLNNKKTGDPFTRRDLYISTVISDRISHFLDKLYAGKYKDSEMNQILNTFDILVKAVKRYQKKRSFLPDLVLRIIEKIGASEEDKAKALYVSVLHDLGLALFDEKILQKKSLLPAEIRAIRTHPNTTIELLSIFEFSEDIKRAILSHHERYDGSGYPQGLKGHEIPLISRILSVADSFNAMISERPYRETLTWENALSEIKANSGSIYDPEVVRAFEEVLPEIMA